MNGIEFDGGLVPPATTTSDGHIEAITLPAVGCACGVQHPTSRARAFDLVRDVDVTGVSGTGVVASGFQYGYPYVVRMPFGNVELAAGWCTMRWNGELTSLALYRSIDDVIAIHGHNGATRVQWVDADPTG